MRGAPGWSRYIEEGLGDLVPGLEAVSWNIE